MSWIKLDDRFPDHEKTLAAGPEAAWLFVTALCWSSRHEADGRIPESVMHHLAPNGEELADRLIAAGLVKRLKAGFSIVNYTKHQRSREEIEFIRTRGKRRVALHRDPDTRDQIRARDRDLCRYCGRRVNWKDRRGELGGTYDHVDPEGPNTVENLVVACRQCNSRKGSRTPEQARIQLRPAPYLDTTRADTESDPETEFTPQPLSRNGRSGRTAADDEIGQSAERVLEIEQIARTVLERIADSRLDQAKDVKNRIRYREKILGQLPSELDLAKLRTLIADHPGAPIDALAGALLGEPNSLHQHRAEPSTA